ncbi:MAG: hypothetical protein PHR35_01995 [Kiritimatiellae bacterium]|nr:hypothetical protein [Kiritimatiellia bacterium]
MSNATSCRMPSPVMCNPSKAIYNYRYFLPHAPQWGSIEHCRNRLEELLAFCRGARIDAVQFYVNTLPGTYYMPAHNANEQREWAAWMKAEVAPALRRAGISYQLNLQMLLGATSYGVDMRDEYQWEFLVNQHGTETDGCACPLSPSFRRIMGEMLRLWAATEPDIVWVDDDFRLHNHGKTSDGLDFYCYCKRHLAEFARVCGRRYTRPQLVAAVLKPGAPSQVRAQWLDFLGRTMTETAAWIRHEIQGVSPGTRLAQMTSMPDVHAVEGRNWKAFMTALCGKARPLTRPCSGCYAGTSAPVKYQTVTYRSMGQSIATLEQTLGPGKADYGPELENTRFTTWSKSGANTRYVLTLAQLLGCPEITLSLHDLEGTPIREEPTLEPLLRSEKPRLQALADLKLRDWRAEGVVFLNDPDSARKVCVGPKARMQDLGLLRDWEDVLLQMGIPAHYASPAAAAAGRDVVALERYTAWLPSDRELKKMLAGAVLLDGGAVEVLQQRGFGRYLGVRADTQRDYGIVSEVYADGILPGVSACRMPHRGWRWHEIVPVGAQVASRLVDSKNRHHTGSTVFINELGGRVAIYASVGDFAMGTFGCHGRLRWLHGVLRWLSRESFVVLPRIPHHGLTVVRSQGRRTLLAFANLGTDVLRDVRFRFGEGVQPRRAMLLDPKGAWIPCRLNRAADEVRVSCRLNAFDWLVLLLDRH